MSKQNNLQKGIIVKLTGGNYYVKTEQNKIYKTRARGKFRNVNQSPVVGDYVEFEITENDEGYIMNILERKNILYRPKVANVDYGIIVTSVCEPKLNHYLLDKLIAILEIYNIEPILLFTKTCLTDVEYMYFYNYIRSLGYSIYISSDVDEYDVTIRKQLANKTSFLVGQTGVGKSTFINNLDTNLNLATAEISKALGRGKHTTRHTEIFYVDDIRVVDSPGFSSIEFLDNIADIDIAHAFREFDKLSVECKYATSIHIN